MILRVPLERQKDLRPRSDYTRRALHLFSCKSITRLQHSCDAQHATDVAQASFTSRHHQRYLSITRIIRCGVQQLKAAIVQVAALPSFTCSETEGEPHPT